MGGTVTTLRPEVVSQLSKSTQFSHAEICDLYRQFRADTHLQLQMQLDRAHFEALYRNAFPDGVGDQFAHLVFRAFCKAEKDGHVTFENFIVTLSDPLTGTQQEQNAWLFGFFDQNSDGRISKQEMLDVIQAVASLNGGYLYSLRHMSEEQFVDYSFEHCAFDSKDYLNKGEFMAASTTSTTLRYVLEATLNAVLTPYITRKARTGSFGKARSNSVVSMRRLSRSSSGTCQETDLDSSIG